PYTTLFRSRRRVRGDRPEGQGRRHEAGQPQGRRARRGLAGGRRGQAPAGRLSTAHSSSCGGRPTGSTPSSSPASVSCSGTARPEPPLRNTLTVAPSGSTVPGSGLIAATVPSASAERTRFGATLTW